MRPLTAGPKLVFGNDEYERTVYGVDALQSLNSGRAQYVPKGGLTEAGLDLGAMYLVTARWSVGAAIGREPDSVAYDAALQRIYCAGGLGTLTVVQQDDSDTYRVLQSVSARLAAHTLTIDPESHEVYVAYAGFFAAPRIAVFAAQP